MKSRSSTIVFKDIEGLNQAILDSVNYILIATDLDGFILAYNTAVEIALGFSAEEVIQKTTPAIWHDSHEVEKRAIELTQELKRKIEPGFRVFVEKLLIEGSETSEWTFIRKNKTTFPGKLTATAIRNKDNTLIGYLGMIEDLTQFKEQEAEKRALLERLTLAIRSQNMGIWDWDIIHNHIVWDARMYDLYDINPAQKNLLYETWESKVHPEDRANANAEVQAALKGEKNFDTEFRVIKHNGETCYIKASANIKRDHHGMPSRLVGINWDITELKKADIAKNEFISVISHELRTPLTAISGAIRLLQSDKTFMNHEKNAQLLTIANENSNRLLQLINDLLDFEKLSEKKLSLLLTRQNSAALIESACQLNALYAEKFKTRLKFNTTHHDYFINVDTNKFQQIMSNLLSNAAKFATPNSDILIHLTKRGDYARIAIENTGPGIPIELQSKVFQRFFQVDSSASRRSPGTGLGLAITKALVEQMQGQIGFTSIPHQTTTFYFDLPLAKASEGA